MARIEIVYGGSTYFINGRTVDEVKVMIEAAVQADGGWLTVVDGSGPTQLFISRGVPIALTPLSFADD